MSNYCDIHGLDLPCTQCFKDRIDEFNYLKAMIEYEGLSFTEDEVNNYMKALENESITKGKRFK
jgi:hypothetical protein